MPKQLEIPIVEKGLDIAACAGEEIVDADDLMAVGNQSLAQMRTDEAGAARNQTVLADAPGRSSRHDPCSLECSATNNNHKMSRRARRRSRGLSAQGMNRPMVNCLSRRWPPLHPPAGASV
ncbi:MULTISPECIES: hypothetical protein [unclassified Bradyrhizobium]|uniref:hypothetical protein n=1 Tax=unclassified Bradyrhizobium TaxID=2631580 RepID=UPI002916C1E5|nr:MULTISPECIES: hypothetical protein [unclassified Bradyrhizobium]